MRRLPLLCLLLLIAGQASGRDSKSLVLRSRVFDPLRLPPQKIQGRVQVVQAKGSARGILDELEERGCSVLGYLPEDAYIVRLPAADALQGMAGIRWRGGFDPAWKRSPHLDRMECRPTCRLEVFAHPGRFLDGSSTGYLEVEVEAGSLAAALERLTALDDVAWVEPRARVELTNDDSVWMIQGGEVRETATPLFDRGLTGRGEIVGVVDSGLDTDACQFRYSADPSAQTLLNNTQPPGVNVTNPDNKVISYHLYTDATAYDDRAKLGHGTHVAGCIAGDNYAHPAGDSDPGRDAQDGMAPGAKIFFQDIGRRDGNQTGLPAVLTDMYLQAYDSGARIHNNSFGKDSPDTEYGGHSRSVDEAAWGLQDLLIVYSSGNEGPGERTLAGFGATAKNSVVVGASLPGSDNWGYGVCSFSSQGPTSDGRMRPDLVAPGVVRSALETAWIETGGTDIYGNPQADSTTDPPNDNCAVDTEFRTGTSYAAPLVSGGAALVREYFRKGYYPAGGPNAGDGFDPSAALLKAVLCNSALSIGSGSGSMAGPFRNCETGENLRAMDPAPNNIEGWGVIRLDRTLYFPGDADRLAILTDTWNDGGDRGVSTRVPLEQGRTHVFGLENVRPGRPLRVTLAWMDPAGSTGSGRVLVNDLDLEVQDSSGNLYKGNRAFSQNRSQPAGSQGPDSLNPLEQVIVEVDAEQDCVVRVIGRSVPGNGRTTPFLSTRQGYALIAAGDFDAACYDGPCGGVQPDGDAGAGGDDGGVGPDDPVSGDDAAGSDPGGGDDAPADAGGAGDDRGGVEGSCGCGGVGRAGWFWWTFLLVSILWRRRRNS